MHSDKNTTVWSDLKATAIPLKKSPSKLAGGETRGESRLTMDFITISSAFRPYCRGQGTSEEMQPKEKHQAITGKKPLPCCQSWTYSDLWFRWLAGPHASRHPKQEAHMFTDAQHTKAKPWHQSLPTRQITKLSSLLATMEAKRCSPASSEMRNTYSGAVTWLDLWVLPVLK